MDADVVVIGAGALGLSTALHCAIAGRSVVVVERHTAGSQASGRAAGLFKSVQADELRTRLARRSITRALTFADWAGVPLPVARSGSFLIARTTQHREYLAQELAQSRRWGADVRAASRTELSYYQPAGDEYALWCPEDVYIEEPASLIQACLAACRRLGAVVAENEAVIGIPVTAGRAAGVETERQSIAAPVVVDAAGGWVRQVAGLAGARVPVAPVRHQLLITEPTTQIDPADPIARVVDAAVYLRPARGGLMVGGFEPGPLPLDPDQQPASFSTDDMPLDLGVLRKLAGQVAAETPVGQTAPVAEHRGGLFTMSPDGRFVTGPVPDLQGLWVASGCNGSGFSSSLAIGEALAAWITGDTPPPGMTALAPGRFGPLADDVLISRGLWQYAHYYDPAGGAPEAAGPDVTLQRRLPASAGPATLAVGRPRRAGPGGRVMTVMAPPGMDFMTDAVAHWAAVRPDAEALTYSGALTYGGARWTWAQWHDRIRRVAGGLAALGLGHGDRVAFLDKNNPACLEVALGAGQLGAACAVINWRLAAGELDYVINDSGASVLFAGADLLPAVEAIRDRLPGVTDVITVGGPDDGYEAFLATARPADRGRDVSGEDLWLVMYSSGTTGRPKGVMLSHRNIVEHTKNAVPLAPLGPGDRNLVAMPLFHVGGTCYALFGIYAGAPSTFTREPDPASLLAAFAAGATHAFLVPAVVSALLAAGEKAIAALSGLKYLLYGAAPMPLAMLRQALAAWPEMSFVQVYGQTELAGVISALSPQAHRDASRPDRLVSAGTLLPGAEVRVVDPGTGRDVAMGQPGEFWFRSPQRMMGYLNKPADTAEAITEEGWLRSGDIGHIDDGGYLYVSDRVKDMIITGGENVYSPEVEQVVAEHPAVAEVAVIGVPDDRWGEIVKAVIALRPGQHATGPEIIDFTRERLAHYKCPGTVDIVDALPRNPSGKILKRTLRAPYWEGRDRQV